jgi:hypothetical protein
MIRRMIRREILSRATGPPAIAWRGTIVGSTGEP